MTGCLVPSPPSHGSAPETTMRTLVLSTSLLLLALPASTREVAAEPGWWVTAALLVISILTVSLALLSYRWWRRGQHILQQRVEELTVLDEAGRTFAQAPLSDVDELARLVEQR